MSQGHAKRLAMRFIQGDVVSSGDYWGHQDKIIKELLCLVEIGKKSICQLNTGGFYEKKFDLEANVMEIQRKLEILENEKINMAKDK